MRRSAACCTFSRAVVSGECCRKDFPKWRTVHSYFQKWSEPDPDGISVLERALKKISWRGSRSQGRNCTTRFLIVDAQSVKNTDTAGQKGYDAGKKVSGIKRHIAVDTQALPHAIAVTTADVTDRNGALAALDRCTDNLQHVSSMLATRASHFHKPYNKSSAQRYRSPNEANCTPSPSCPNGGSSNGPLRDSKNVGDSGRTANEN